MNKISRMASVAAAALLSIFPTLAEAQTARFNTMEKDIRVRIFDMNGKTSDKTMTIADAFDIHKVEGAAIVTIDNGKIEAVRHYGWRNKQERLPVDGDTIFYTASISKFIAALAMAKAARLGDGPKLGRVVGKIAASHPGSLMQDWYNTRQKFFWTADAPNGPSIQRLLSHTAGLTHHGIGISLSDCQTLMRNILMGNKACDEESTSPWISPGIVWDYSGGGFTLAEHALELVSGRSASDYLLNEVMVPYGMWRSSVNKAAPSMTHLARPCSNAGSIPCALNTRYSLVKFAGGILAHPEDYANLLALVVNDGVDILGRQKIDYADIEAVLTPMWHTNSTMKICTANSQCTAKGEYCFTGKCRLPLSDGGQRYGLGIKVENEHYKGLPRIVHHGGTQPDIRTEFKLDRKNKTGIVVFATGPYEFFSSAEMGAQPFVSDVIAAWERHYTPG